ncbi:phosphatase PAP2 family protein [Paenibacillus popilliae]|nr:phosphatase PAP2 family protein [Paenibacillus sp. SDF0028]
MTAKWSKFAPLFWMLVIPALNIVYGILNHGADGASSLMTDLDRMIPMIPVFIIPYILWYPIIVGTFCLLCMKDRQLYYRTLITLCGGLILCYSVYYLFQTTVPRPDVNSNGIISSMVQFIYATDQPYNCFPSIHVLSSYIIIKAVMQCRHISKHIKSFIVIFCWFIIASTLFVKQHVLLDVAGGILLAELLNQIQHVPNILAGEREHANPLTRR